MELLRGLWVCQKSRKSRIDVKINLSRELLYLLLLIAGVPDHNGTLPRACCTEDRSLQRAP